MNRFCAASVLIVAGVATFAMASDAVSRECSVLLGCAGMELAQGAGPGDAAPGEESGAPPDGGSDDGNSPPSRGNDKGDDGGEGGDQGAEPDLPWPPPDTARPQPPGCIFQNQPLDLLV